MQSQALRLARSAAPLRRASAVRCLATAAHPAPASASASASGPSIIPLSNVEAQWAKLTSDEQLTVHAQLEELQKKDWKTLSLDEKKAAYYVAFGPHGPRAPTHKPGDTFKIIAGTAAVVAVAGVLTLVARSFAAPPAKTMTKEWQEASNERALEAKLDPISGISSEGYQGKGFVQSK